MLFRLKIKRMIKIKGFSGVTLIDYPNNISSIVYTGGCNFRCPFCYNKRLVINDLIENNPDFSVQEILYKLENRINFIDGVVITGGEPTIWGSDLIDFIKQIKQLKLKVKLDTNGSNPDVIVQLLNENYLDYIAMDIKTSPLNYSAICDIDNISEKIIRSINIIRDSKVDYEWRTTVYQPLIDKDNFKSISNYVKTGDKYYLQKFSPIVEELIEPSKNINQNISVKELHDWIQPIKQEGIKIYYRGY